MWEPENLFHLDSMTWRYTNEQRHFWPPEGLVPTNASLIIDAGANAGLSTGLLAYEWKEARVIGIEMNPETAQRARENLGSFGDRVEIITTAIGYPEREGIAVHTTANAVDHLKDYPWDAGMEHIVQIKELDNILSECGVENQTIDLLKMDIEGAEWEVLQDNGKWSKKTKVFILEAHSYYREGAEFSDRMKMLGFNVETNEFGQFIGTRP
jgi:FkbM family methyltransferase